MQLSVKGQLAIHASNPDLHCIFYVQPDPDVSVAAAASCHHIIILFQHHILCIIKVKQVDGEELVGDAAGCIDAFDQLQSVDDGLDGGMVGGPHVLTQGEGAGAFAVVGVVAARRHDPTRPADLLKVDVEGLALAGRRGTVLLAVVQ